MGDGVGVPALGQHRDRHDAADVLAELAGLADRVHHLAQQVLVGQVLGVAAGEARAVLGLELLDLARAAIFLKPALIASPDSSCARVDQDACSAGAASAPSSLVAEQGELARDRRRRAVGRVGFSQPAI